MSFTDPATLPNDIKQKLLAARDALIQIDVDGAYHQLYSIADPYFVSFYPWKSIQQAPSSGQKNPWPPPPGHDGITCLVCHRLQCICR